MTSRRLTPDLIATDTYDWELFLRLAPDSLSALILGPQGPERTVVAHSEPLADPDLKTLENAIYDNPLILSDFSKVTILLSTSQLVQIPGGVAPELYEEIAGAMLPDSDAERTPLVSEMPDGSLLIAAIDMETLNFLRRSFPDARFMLSFSCLANGLAALRPEGKAQTFALFMPEELAIVSFDREGRLTFANRYDVQTADDCAYYILAAGGTELTSVCMGGDANMRNETIEKLNQAAPSLETMPLFLPKQLVELLQHEPTLPPDLIFTTES